MTDTSPEACKTPMQDHVNRAFKYMRDGCRISIEAHTGLKETALFPEDTCKAIVAEFDRLSAENTALKAQRDAAIKRANSQGGRYWEGRWRDTQAELDALKAQVVSVDRDAIARAVWENDEDEYSFDDAFKGQHEDSDEGRSHKRSLKWIYEIADAAISTLSTHTVAEPTISNHGKTERENATPEVQALVEALKHAHEDLEGALLAHVASGHLATANCVKVTMREIDEALAAYEEMK